MTHVSRRIFVAHQRLGVFTLVIEQMVTSDIGLYLRFVAIFILQVAM